MKVFRWGAEVRTAGGKLLRRRALAPQKRSSTRLEKTSPSTDVFEGAP